ncbi:MAG: hypothetical protein NXY57DRAFT_1044539, partial [Lentinula lateritia]
GSITRVPQDPRTQQNIQKGVTKFFADEKVRKVLGVTGKLETTFPVNRCEYYGNNPGFGQSVYKGKMVQVSFGGLEICGGTCIAKVVIGVGSGGALKVQGRIYNSATKLIFPVIPENKASERFYSQFFQDSHNLKLEMRMLNRPKLRFARREVEPQSHWWLHIGDNPSGPRQNLSTQFLKWTASKYVVVEEICTDTIDKQLPRKRSKVWMLESFCGYYLLLLATVNAREIPKDVPYKRDQAHPWILSLTGSDPPRSNLCWPKIKPLLFDLLTPTIAPTTILIIMHLSTISLLFLGLSSIAFAAPRPMESNLEGAIPGSSSQDAKALPVHVALAWDRPAGKKFPVPQDSRTQQNIQNGVRKFFGDKKVGKALGVTGKLEATLPVGECEYYAPKANSGQMALNSNMVQVSFGGLEICGGTCTATVVIGVRPGGDSRWRAIGNIGESIVEFQAQGSKPVGWINVDRATHMNSIGTTRVAPSVPAFEELRKPSQRSKLFCPDKHLFDPVWINLLFLKRWG